MKLRLSTRVFDNIIAEWRTKNKLSQKALAEVLGSSVQSVASWEKGISRPTKKYANKISSLMGIEIEEFYEKLKGDDSE
jgi:transcriptional regulator with XRE-family HTH domain